MAIYPNEKWPANGVVEALDGDTDAATGLPYIPKGVGPTSEPSYEIQYNRRLMRQNRILAGWRQGMVVDEGELKIGVYPLVYGIDGQQLSFEGASGVVIPDDASRVVYLDDAAELQLAPTWPVELTSCFPLAEVTAAGGQLSIEDRRGWAVFRMESPQRQWLTAQSTFVDVSQSDLELLAFIAPGDLSLEAVQIHCSSVSANVTVDVRVDGVSILSVPVAPVSGNVIQPVVVQAQISDASRYSVHVSTDGSGTVHDLTVLSLFRMIG